MNLLQAIKNRTELLEAIRHQTASGRVVEFSAAEGSAISIRVKQYDNNMIYASAKYMFFAQSKDAEWVLCNLIEKCGQELALAITHEQR